MEAAAKHTPGPWQIAEAVQSRYTPTNMRRVRAVDEGHDHGAVCEVYGVRDDSVAAANARLIAAAPELLAALVNIERNCGGSVTEQYIARLARAAIAKATGSQA